MPAITPAVAQIAELGAQIYSADFSQWPDCCGGSCRWETQPDGRHLIVGPRYVSADNGPIAPSPASGYAAEIAATLLEGDEGSQYGMISGDSATKHEYYLVLLSKRGAVTLQRQANDEWETLGEWTPSEDVDVGEGSENVLRLVVQDSLVQVHLNGYPVAEVTIPGPPLGDLGLAGESAGSATTHVVFSRFEVWALSDAPPPM